MSIGGVGTASLHHRLREIVDNAVNEVSNGHASRIVVARAVDGKTVTVADNGRGIHVDVTTTASTRVSTRRTNRRGARARR
jgi:DNA gyrase subunit B/topoisomerase-4 subunit B